MSAPTISELLAAPTSDQIYAGWITQLVAVGVPADKWRAGGTYSTIMRYAAVLCASFAQSLVQVVQSFYLYSATGGWLTLLAYYVYGVTRAPATFASGAVTFTNTGGGIYTYAAGQVTLKNSVTGQSYVTTQALSLAALGTATVNVQAVAAGSAGSSPPGGVDTLVTVMLGVTVGNALAVVGSDAQSDTDLQAACTNKLGSLSIRGPRTGYAWAVSIAKQADGVTPVNINRVSVSTSSHTGTVTITLASPSGVPVPSDVASAAISIDLNARPSAVTVNVQACTTIVYNPLLTVWAQALPGLTSSSVSASAGAAIDTLLATYPIGGLATDTVQGLFGSAVDGAIKAAVPAVFKIDGAVDLVLTPGLVATNGATIAVRLVSPS